MIPFNIAQYEIIIIFWRNLTSSTTDSFQREWIIIIICVKLDGQLWINIDTKHYIPELCLLKWSGSQAFQRKLNILLNDNLHSVKFSTTDITIEQRKVINIDEKSHQKTKNDHKSGTTSLKSYNSIQLRKANTTFIGVKDTENNNFKWVKTTEIKHSTLKQE